jgi:error-prone DNA polymerase
VAYKSAFLRAHYPAEFMAAVISNGGGYYATPAYLSEARRMGLRILPPDINASEIKYTGRDREVRVGLMQIKDLSRELWEAVVHERRKRGPFASLREFLKRMGPRVRLQDARLLVKAGCFDGVAGGAARPGLMWQAHQFFFRKKEDRAPGLFDRVREGPPHPLSAPQPGSYSQDLLWKHERETLGFVLSAHPLEIYGRTLQDLGHVPARDLRTHVGRTVTTVGWPVTGKTVQTRAGDPMRFVSFEDTTGIYETVLFPRVYHRYCHLLNAARPYLLKGRVEQELGAVTVTVERLGLLKGAENVDDRQRQHLGRKGQRS